MLVQANRAVSSLPYFTAALEINPDKEQYWLSYINALIDTSNYALARQVLTERRERGLAGEAADLLDAQLEAPTRTAVDEVAALFNQGDLVSAEAMARGLTERFPQHGFGWKALGAVLMSQQRYAEALEPLQRAAILFPDAENKSNLGTVLQRLGQYTKAEKCYRNSIEIDPGNVNALSNMGMIFSEQGRLGEAETCFKKVLEINPDSVAAAEHLSEIHKRYERRAARTSGIYSHQHSGPLSGQSHSKPAFNPLGHLRGKEHIGKVMTLFGGVMFLYGAFMSWGGKANSSSYAAKVDDVEISMVTFNSTYTKNRDRVRQGLGAGYTPELEAKFAVKKTTLDTLVNQEILRNAAVRHGFGLSDDEVVQSIASMPAFQKNGGFDLVLYKQILAQNNLTPKQFENNHRYDMIAEKMRRSAIASVQVTEKDIKSMYHKERDLMVLSYVALSPADVRNDVVIAGNELQDFFEKNRHMFMTPEKVSVSFIRFDVDRKKAGEPISQEEVERYFNINLKRYQVTGNVIPVFQSVKEKVIEDLQKEKKKKVLFEKAANVRYKHATQSDLKSVADELGVSVRKTGMFASTAPPPEFMGEDTVIKRILSLKDGEIGGPFETANAVYLVQVVGREPSTPASFASVRSLIENKLRNEKSIELSRKKAEEALKSFSQGKTPPNLRETEAFNYNSGGKIPGIGVSQDLMTEATVLTTQQAVAKKIYTISARWYAVRLKKRLIAPEDDYARVKDDLLKRITLEKQQKKMEEWFAEQRTKVKLDINKQLAADIVKESSSYINAN